MRSITPDFQKSPPRGWIASFAATGLLAVAGLANAVTVTTHDVTASGGVATVVFDFDFGSNTLVDGFVADLNFNSTLLSLTGSAATYNGVALDPTTFFGSEFSANASPQGYTAAWLPFNGPLFEVSLSGKAEWSVTFDYVGAMQPTSVGLDFTFTTSDGNGNISDGLVNGAISSPQTALISVAAVPEPETWALTLAGLGFVGLQAARARRNKGAVEA